MAERDIQALAEAAEVEPRTRSFLRWAGSDRVLLVLVFTDIVGSTALNEAIKDEQMDEVRRAHFTQSRKLIDDYAGYEIKTIGDAFLVAFRSTDKALDYAITLYKEPGAPDLRMRVGIHMGSVSLEGWRCVWSLGQFRCTRRGGDQGAAAPDFWTAG